MVLLGLSLTFIPGILLRDYVEDFLAEQDLKARGLEDVELNIFTLTLETGPFELINSEQEIISLDSLELSLSLTPLARQRINIHGATLNGLHLGLVEDPSGAITVRAMPPVGGGEDDGQADWLFGLTNFAIANSRLDLELSQITGRLDLEYLELRNFKTWTPEQPGEAEFRAKFGDGAIAGSARITPFADDITTEFTLLMEQFPLDALALEAELGGAFGLDVEGRATIGDSLRVLLEGQSSFSDVTVLVGDETSASLDRLSITLEMLELSQENEGPAGSIDASIEGSALAATVGDSTTGMTARIDALRLAPRLSLRSASDFEGVMRENVIIEGLAVASVKGPQVLASREVRVSEAKFDSTGTVSASAIAVEGLRALEPDTDNEPLAQIASLNLRGISRSKEDVTVSSIEAAGLAMAVDRTEAGIAQLSLLEGLAQETAEETAEEIGEETVEGQSESGQSKAGLDEASAQGPSIEVGSFRFLDRATLSFSDTSVPTPVAYEVSIENFALENVSTGDPDKQGSIDLLALFGGDAELRAQGTLNASATPSPSFNLDGNFSGLELHRISPYAASVLGVNLKSGRLDLAFSGGSNKGELNVETDWLIRQIALEELDRHEKEGLSETLNVPVETAINLLQDKDGTIDLNVPIRGQLDNPDFDLSQVINKAIGNAIGGAV
ncbi:MAG: DUF748 domain-containing protein, partial [Alphaproteobacteria bacterium]|nr:DUF748 domain-containing protein [Alphaproteobacteria bacterium]